MSEEKYYPPPFEEFARGEQLKRAADLLHKAQRLSRKGVHDEAIKLLRQATELDPDWQVPRTMEAFSLLELNRIPEALAAAKGGVDADPEVAAAHLVLSVALERQGRWSDALREYEKVCKLDVAETSDEDADSSQMEERGGGSRRIFKTPTDAKNSLRGACHKIYKEFTEAELRSEIAILKGKLSKPTIGPEEVQLKLASAFIVLAMKLMPDELGKRADLWNDFLELVDQLGKEAPHGRAMAFLNLGDIAQRKQSFEEAEANYLKALDENPPPSWRFLTLVSFQSLRCEQRKFEQAEPLIREALALAEKLSGGEECWRSDLRGDLYWNLAEIRAQAKDYDSALLFNGKIAEFDQMDKAKQIAMRIWYLSSKGDTEAATQELSDLSDSLRNGVFEVFHDVGIHVVSAGESGGQDDSSA